MGRLRGIGKKIKRGDLPTLTLLFAVISALVGGIWVVIVTYFPPDQPSKPPSRPPQEVTAENGSVAAGRDINNQNGIIINNTGDAPTFNINTIDTKQLAKFLAREIKGEDEKDQRIAELEKELEAVKREAVAGDKTAETVLTDIEAGKVEDATALLGREAKALAEKSANAAKDAARLYRRQGLLLFLYDTKGAMAAYREATRLDPENPDGWNRLGHLLLRTGALEEAEAAYKRVLDMGHAMAGDEGKEAIAIATGNLGLIEQTRGNLDKAEDYYKQSLALSKELGRKEGMANQYGNLGLIEQTRGNLKNAEDYHQKSLALNKELGRKEGMAASYSNLGLIEQTRGNLEKAEDFLKQSLALSKELGRKEGMAASYGNLGVIEQTRGNLEKAEDYHKQSLALNKELGRKEGMANQYGNLGLIEQTRGNLDKAEEYLKQSLALSKELGRKEGMASDYANLGNLAKQRGERTEACRLWQQSLALFTEVGAKPQIERVSGWIKAYCPKP